MTKNTRTITTIALLLGLLLLVAAGCGRDDADESGDTTTATAGGGSELSGRIEADGSSTVGPFTTAAAERFQREHGGVQVTVGISGTGGGFERFCAGETDLSNASRPIKDEEKEICEQNGVDFVELHAVNDGLAVVIHPDNDWASCLTVAELNTIWRPEAEGEIQNWNQVRDGFPDERLLLAGAGTDSGTFDYFTEEINGDTGVIRTDFQASEDDNVTVQAVSGSRGGMGFFGLSYVEENAGKIKAIEVDGGDGCVAPSAETVQDGTYKPLGRPLFLYAKNESFVRPEVQAFMSYILDNNAEISEAALFVPLTEEQLEAARASLDEAIEEVAG
ncbi:MAG TPA: PstS family phosphate ABC transporter substrate-binding protein [Gaiellaceae bacterium]|nr:PstS family phosphate ABC transporter substrate-binding protein [Gaiellaceae bacterium]